MAFNRGFVTLFVLQALVFVAAFSGFLVYQVHRLRDANRYRLQALSEKAMLKAAVPKLLMCMQRHDGALPTQLKMSCTYFVKHMLIEPVADDGTAVVLKITALREHARRGCWAYFFVERQRDKTSDRFVYRGQQFGAAL